MNYRIVCRYLPDARVCAVAKRPGAWRLLSCSDHRAMLQREPIKVIHAGHDGPLLLMYSHRARQPNTWINPAKVLREWLAQRREYGVEWEDVIPAGFFVPRRPAHREPAALGSGAC